jgi:hypothetical protein
MTRTPLGQMSLKRGLWGVLAGLLACSSGPEVPPVESDKMNKGAPAVDQTYDDQVDALRALRSSTAPESIDALLGHAEKASSDRLRGVAADQLSMKAAQYAARQWKGADAEALKARFAQSAPRVIALLGDGVPAVRTAMLNVAAKAGIKAALDKVKDLAASDPDMDVRMQAAQALHPLSKL